MELLNPLMLWGGLAVAIPIIFHFWHQKKGKVLEWAATQWLIEKKLQQSRGIRLDNIPLLLIRCLLLLLLCFFLSKPVVNWVVSQSSVKKIHLVQPNGLITSNFKFELEEALRKGEKLYWIQTTPSPVEDINQLPDSKEFNPLILQSCLNKLSQVANNGHLELYFVNTQDLAQVPNIFVPVAFSLHTVIDSTAQTPRPFLAFGNTKLFVNASNQLSSQAELDKNEKYSKKALSDGPIEVLILNHDKVEKQTISASLKALAEVFNIDSKIDTASIENKKYNWVFTDKPLPTQSKSFSELTLHIISGTYQIPANTLSYQKNTIHIPYSLNPKSSEQVFNGELPEWLGEILVKHYELNPSKTVLSTQQLHYLFRYARLNESSGESEFSKILLLLFIITLGIERFIAIRKNA